MELMPDDYTFFWSLGFTVSLVVFVASLVGLAVASRHMSLQEVIAWLAVIVLIPVVGGAIWLAFGQRRYRSGRPQGTNRTSELILEA